MFRLFECCALSFFERFVLSFSLKIERFVSDSAEIWICGLYIEDSNSLFTPLNLICETDKDTYMFNYDTRSNLPSLIFLYALLVKFEGQNSISFDDIAELALIFCLTNNDLLNVIKKVCDLYPSEIVFSDVAGIKELQFRTTINSIDVLNRYYEAN